MCIDRLRDKIMKSTQFLTIFISKKYFFYFTVSKMNPLEQFFNSGDVEMIDPKDSTSNDLNDQKSDNRVFEIEIIGPYSLVRKLAGIFFSGHSRCRLKN